MLILPEGSGPYIAAQRTDYKKRKPITEYGYEILGTYEKIKPFLPEQPETGRISILDIGSGMGTIDVFLSRHYDHKAKITLLDRIGDQLTNIVYGYIPCGKEVSPYNNFDLAKSLLELNGVPTKNIVTHDIDSKPFPRAKYDLVISLLSWGFHYPISTYTPHLKENGVIIVDVRKGSDSEKDITKLGKVTFISEGTKSFLVACQV